MPPELETQVDLTTDIVENDGNIGSEGQQPTLGDNASVRELLEQAAQVREDEQGRVREAGQIQLIPEYQGILSALPEEHRTAVQSVLEARETAVSRYVQEVQARVNGYAGIEQVIGPRREAWAMAGIAPEAAVNQLFALSDFASRDPQQFIEWFAANNNIDLSAIGESYIPPDPQFTALTNKITYQHR
jgi:hypothetical protein